MAEGILFDALDIDSLLVATAVNNTGTASEVYEIGKRFTRFFAIKAVFPNPATDDVTVDLYLSIDGVKFQSTPDHTWSFARTAGATKYQNVVVSPTDMMLAPDGTTWIKPGIYCKFIVKSAGVADTPAITLYTRSGFSANVN